MWKGRSPRRLAVAVGVAILAATTSVPPGFVPTVVAADPPNHQFLNDGGTAPAKGPGLAAAPAAAALLASPGFQDTVAFTGLTNPTAVRFSPDGRVFVAEKSGIIRVFASITATTSTVFADLSSKVDNYWDRGLLGLALDPGFPATPYVYVLYTYDAPIGGTAPVWNDACPTPPGPTTDGCVVSGRLSRLQAAGNVMTGAELPLINDWCQQFPSHSIGDLQFGPDGALYVSGGDGASFGDADYGQFGGGSGSPTQRNPCGDPPGGVGGSMTPPTAEGGALRSQSVRRPTTEPVVLNGTILRVDPATGNALPTNPLNGSSSANARRLVGYGFRNPFRFTFRPGTSELWVGDVGYNTWEEIDRITSPTASTVSNGGWPCYEGPSQQASYAAVGLNLCSTLYSNPTGLLTPYFSYNHSSPIVAGESCPTGNGSVVSGIAFYSGGTYPTAYNGAMFFADHSRNCIWAMRAGTNGLPDSTRLETLIAGAANPVALQIGPGGDLFYVDFDGGTIHRVVYNSGDQPPVAVIGESATGGRSPLTVTFDASQSSDPDPGDTLTYSWDLNGDGTFGDSTVVAPSFTYTSLGLYTVGLRVTDSHGLSSTDAVTINVDNAAPTVTIDTPSASLTWAVGDVISFSGHATDSTGAALPGSALSWELVIHHCIAVGSCHIHDIQSFAGASGSVSAPDHPYPSYLELQLTATDSAGRTATTSVSLQPKTVGLSMASVPSGLNLIVSGNNPATTPFTATVIVNSAQSLIAPETQVVGTTTYVFDHWSDGGAATHGIVAGSTGATYTATYTAQTGTTRYLSDLAYSVVANGWGPAEKDMSNGEQAAGDGRPLTLAGIVYAKGIGAHAASDIRYTMSACSLFTAKVGVDDEVGNNGSVNFQVFADGTKVYDSGVLTGSSPTATVSLDMTGKTSLQLVITNGGNNVDYDHGDWADAQLTCGSSAPTPPTVTGTTPANGATGVATSVAPTATFATASSTSIDPATVNTTTVSLTNQATSAVVPATVSFSAATKTATLTPTAALGSGTIYLARVKGGSSGVKDLAGTALAADVTWTFTTLASVTATQVRIETAANGSGTVVPAQSLAAGSSITAYAISRDASGGFVANVPASWSLTSVSGGVVATDLVVASDTRSATFTGHAAGTAVIHPVVSGLSSVDSGTITVTAQTGTTRYLSDLAYSVVANGWGPAEKDMSNGEQAAGDGRPLTLAGIVYAKGIGAHAASDIRYTMSACSLFTAKVGVDDEVGNNGSVNFQVFADGTKVYDSGVLTGSSPTATVSLDMTGKTSLQLVITNGGNNVDYDHGDWADAQLTCGSSAPTPPTVTGTTPANGATGVATSVAPTATFATASSTSIDPATVNTTTVSLTNQATSAVVPATVSFSAATKTATLTPTAALGSGTIYLARVKGGSSGVKDLAGTALAADVTWTFTTLASVTATQVRIETAANGSGTVVPAQSLAAGSSITGYAISRDASGGFVANVPASWSLTSVSGGVVATDLVVASDTRSATFTGHAAGTAVIHPVVSGLSSVDSGTITVTAQTGTTRYLSDLAYSVVANGWGPAEKDMSNGEQAAGDGRPLTLAGIVYAKGIGAHAASDIRYTMSACSLFTAKVGVDDEVGNNGSVNFQVFADGTKVYDSGVLTGSSPTATVSLDMTGTTSLQLVITNGGNNVDYDHGDWADAQLTCG